MHTTDSDTRSVGDNDTLKALDLFSQQSMFIFFFFFKEKKVHITDSDSYSFTSIFTIYLINIRRLVLCVVPNPYTSYRYTNATDGSMMDPCKRFKKMKWESDLALSILWSECKSQYSKINSNANALNLIYCTYSGLTQNFYTSFQVAYMYFLTELLRLMVKTKIIKNYHCG